MGLDIYHFKVQDQISTIESSVSYLNYIPYQDFINNSVNDYSFKHYCHKYLLDIVISPIVIFKNKTDFLKVQPVLTEWLQDNNLFADFSLIL